MQVTSTMWTCDACGREFDCVGTTTPPDWRIIGGIDEVPLHLCNDKMCRETEQKQIQQERDNRTRDYVVEINIDSDFLNLHMSEMHARLGKVLAALKEKGVDDVEFDHDPWEGQRGASGYAHFMCSHADWVEFKERVDDILAGR